MDMGASTVSDGLDQVASRFAKYHLSRRAPDCIHELPTYCRCIAELWTIVLEEGSSNLAVTLLNGSLPLPLKVGEPVVLRKGDSARVSIIRIIIHTSIIWLHITICVSQSFHYRCILFSDI